MTARGALLTLMALIGIGIGVYNNRETLAWLSLTVLVWVFVEWLAFYWRVWIELPRLRIQRTVAGRTDGGTLFAGRKVSVDVVVTIDGVGTGPLLSLRDCLPENFAIESGSNEYELLTRTNQIKFSYEARVRGAGEAMLSGFRLTLKDQQGFFVTQRFVPAEHRFRVLPSYANVNESQPITKRINSLPQHGIHRLQRSGMGSELLELREYATGDPPKSIAWKVSARRDMLMTRQYESEVPVRVVLFLDGCISTRIGGFGQRLLDQSLYVAGSVARAAISVGDPVGAVLFDERGSKRLAPSGGERGFYRLLDGLAEFAVNPPAPQQRLSEPLMTATMRLCGERYPELLEPRVNLVPFTFLPILPWNRSRLFQRTKIASVLAEVYSLQPIQVLELVHDDNMMATYAQRFLAEAGVSWMDPLIKTRSRGFHDAMATTQMLSKAISESVSMSRDNEVYVIMANLLECATNISYLMPALKLALARHHRVVVVCPTPTFRRPQSTPLYLHEKPTAEMLLAVAEDLRTKELASRLQRSLRRIGASMTLSGEEQAIRMILSETQLARSGRVSTARAR